LFALLASVLPGKLMAQDATRYNFTGQDLLANLDGTMYILTSSLIFRQNPNELIVTLRRPF